MEGILAIILLFGGGAAVGISFSPVGAAIASRIRGPVAAPAEELEEVREQLAGLSQQFAGLSEQVAELAERQDFSERLLAQVRERGVIGPGGESRP